MTEKTNEKGKRKEREKEGVGLSAQDEEGDLS
jgi:hypothetical protein